MKHSYGVLLLSYAVSGYSISGSRECAPSITASCKDIMFSITASGMNALFPDYPNSTLPGAVYQYLGSFNASSLPTQMVSGTFNISATYCEPLIKVKGREDTIQLLLHGLAYDKTYWSGINYPNPTFAEEYSWISHALSQGYATLAIDNLGNGNSSHPDPLSVVQSPLQIDVMYQIIHGLHAGILNSIPKQYKKVLFVGHSYGSVIARLVATFHPTNGADAYVLTAASGLLRGITRAITAFQARAASAVYPAQYSEFVPGYLAISPQSVKDTVYSLEGDFDPSLLSWDAETPHLFAVGEIASSKPAVASSFTGPVLVITGELDQIVCGVGNITTQIPDCRNAGASSPDQTGLLFPNSSRFDSYITGKTGHNINTHYSAPESFGAAHQWMQSVGF